MFTLAQQQLGSGAERGAYIRVDAPQQVLALRRVFMGPEMPDAVRAPRVDDQVAWRRPPPRQLEGVVKQRVAGAHREQRRREVVG